MDRGDDVIEALQQVVGEIERAVLVDVHLAAGEDAEMAVEGGVECLDLGDLREQPVGFQAVRLHRGLRVVGDAEILQTQLLRGLGHFGEGAAAVTGGGVVVEIVGGGKGLVNGLFDAAQRRKIDIFYDAHVQQLLYVDKRIRGVRADIADQIIDLKSNAVVLACGGFEANIEWRTRYLGPGWDLAKVRGSRFNTGDGIRMALDVGAQPYGHWSGCHSTEWDLNAPDFGDHTLVEKMHKHCYEFGVVINNDGRRFVDEGADFRTYTYAKYGREILAQPGQAAWQIFDSKVLHLLRRDEYYNKRATRVRADTLEELLARMKGLNAGQALKTLREYNAAVLRDVPFNPNVRDGRGTQGLALPKSNWANTLEDGPFEAYAVTCGITFTFGGVKITPDAEVVDFRNRPIRGLFAAGEMAAGIFYFNYPGSSGLTSGAVFGRIAGRSAAVYAGSAA